MIRDLRLAARMSQFDLAKASGLSRGTIQLIEQQRGVITPISEQALRAVFPDLQAPPTVIEQVRAELEEIKGRLAAVEAQTSGQAA